MRITRRNSLTPGANMGIYIDGHGRNPRSVIADELEALGFADPWDLAGHLLGSLTNQDVADLADIRGVRYRQLGDV